MTQPTYDPNNIFARILRGEIPCRKIYEDDFVLAIHNIHPEAPVHGLVLSKGAYVDEGDFSTRASDAEIIGYARSIVKITHALGIDQSGFRLISNTGPDSQSEIPHYHTHILARRLLGPNLVENHTLG
jgi:histidine triad (HIT) family protein